MGQHQAGMARDCVVQAYVCVSLPLQLHECCGLGLAIPGALLGSQRPLEWSGCSATVGTDWLAGWMSAGRAGPTCARAQGAPACRACEAPLRLSEAPNAARPRSGAAPRASCGAAVVLDGVAAWEWWHGVGSLA